MKKENNVTWDSEWMFLFDLLVEDIVRMVKTDLGHILTGIFTKLCLDTKLRLQWLDFFGKLECNWPAAEDGVGSVDDQF